MVREEVAATGHELSRPLFGICVVALYFASRHIAIASGDGSYEVSTAALFSCLAPARAMAFSFFGDKWSRPYFGLDVAVDAGCLPCVSCICGSIAGALACDFVALD